PRECDVQLARVARSEDRQRRRAPAGRALQLSDERVVVGRRGGAPGPGRARAAPVQDLHGESGLTAEIVEIVQPVGEDPRLQGREVEVQYARPPGPVLGEQRLPQVRVTL